MGIMTELYHQNFDNFCKLNVTKIIKIISQTYTNGIPALKDGAKQTN